MRHFFKLTQGQSNIPLMAEIMRCQEELFDGDGIGKRLPADAKRMAIAIMQLTNGIGLEVATINRLSHDKKFQMRVGNGADRYVSVLSGQVHCLVDNEMPTLNAGEIWWVDPKAEAILNNKSGDDAILLHVSVRMD